jgi:malate dehydrogenase (oxaloacetate-decarboxylating)
VTDGMLSAAAHAVASLVDAAAPGAPLLPPVESLRETSLTVATEVARAAAADGVAEARLDGDIREHISQLMWRPVYRPVRPA